MLRLFFGWLASDKSLSPATWGLVIVTALLVTDGWRKSREQTRRWKHEDERRREEEKPKAVVEITSDSDAQTSMGFTCFNLGNTTFYIDKLIVTTVDNATHVADIEPQIVTPGTSVTVPYNPCELLGWFSRRAEFVEANAVFLLRGASGRETTEPQWFYVGDPPPQSTKCVWYVGRVADRQPGTFVRKPKIMGFHESY
jgi:hypothetical protein